ncbi:hypothetical protein Tco_1214740, partial [Tanacetum coccineum]
IFVTKRGKSKIRSALNSISHTLLQAKGERFKLAAMKLGRFKPILFASWRGTLPRDVIEEIAQTIVATIPNQKSKTEATTEDSASAATAAEPKPTSAKCLLLPELSSDTKKKKEH